LNDPSSQRNLIALHFLEFATVHCSFDFHRRIGTKSFLNNVNNLLINSNSPHVKSRLLHLIGFWAGFFDEDVLPIFKNYFDVLKKKGQSFPPKTVSKYEKFTRENLRKTKEEKARRIRNKSKAGDLQLPLLEALPMIQETCKILNDLFQEIKPGTDVGKDEMINDLMGSITIYQAPLQK
jgi:VHS domain